MFILHLNYTTNLCGAMDEIKVIFQSFDTLDIANIEVALGEVPRLTQSRHLRRRMIS